MEVKTLICALLGLCLAGGAVYAQPSSITYQGRLTDAGSLANTNYDLVFTVYDAVSGGTVRGGPLTNAPVAISNGLFTVTLDFPLITFVNGTNRWLELAVRPFGDTNGHTILTPRNFFTSTPYALRSLNSSFATVASFASVLTGNLPGSSITSTVPDIRLSTNVAFLNTNLVFKGSLTATQFIGNGFGLTNIPLTNVTGQIPDTRLSPNVALLNGNVSFAGSVTATNFIGNGAGLTNVAGRVFDFIPTGANVPAVDNTGYLATNPTVAVVVTLPASPKLGTTVRVSGGAPGGWIIAQNAGQSILAGSLTKGLGLSWTQRDSVRAWDAAAVSADGRKQVAVVNPSQRIYYSTNYGVTWNQSGTLLPNLAWQSAACSADGNTMLAVASSGQIYRSTDSGVNWTVIGTSASGNWTSIACSVDASRIVGTIDAVGIRVSTNSGNTWINVNSVETWTGAASSADGKKMIACATGDLVYTSTNSGMNWTAGSLIRGWTAVASSADGTVLAATATAGGGEQIYTSYDSGATWGATGPGNHTWTGVACSGDGSRMAAVYSAGGIYTSTDSGRSWVVAPGAFSSIGWKGVALSQDGSTAVATATSQPLYVYSQSSTTPGTVGFLSGTVQSAIELQYIGNGVFMPISSMGSISVH